jgi:DNA-binding protein HU-beta
VLLFWGKDQDHDSCSQFDNRKGNDMNKAELIEKVAGQANMSKSAAGETVDALLDSIADSLQRGDSVTLVGFGTFAVSRRSARMGRNPRTGESIHIGASNSAKFKPGKGLKDALNQGTAPESDDSTGGFSPQTSSW